MTAFVKYVFMPFLIIATIALMTLSSQASP